MKVKQGSAGQLNPTESILFRISEYDTFWNHPDG